VVTTGAANSRSRTSKWLPAELVLEADDVHVAGVEEVGGAAVGFQILLLNLEAHDLGIPIAPLDVIDRDGEAPAAGLVRRHRPKQVGCKSGNSALARQVVAEKRNGSSTEGCFHD
jgi:hypothetical protein